MAESQSMTTAEVVAKTLIDEHADFLREAVAMVAARADGGRDHRRDRRRPRASVSAERSTHRNGYRPRAWETRVGEIELAVPRKRSGEAYFPSFLEPRKRSSRRSSASSWRPTSTASRPARSTAWSSSWGSPDDQGPRLAALPGPRRAGRGLPRAPARRAPTPTSGWTPSTSRSETAATSTPRRWWSPTRCTRPAAAR